MEMAHANVETNPAEEIWAILRETARRHEETMKELDRRHEEADRRHEESVRRHEESMKELNRRQEEADRRREELDRLHKETEKLMKDTFDRMDKRSDRLDKQLGNLSNRFGEMVEHMIVPNLITKFRELDFKCTKAHRDTKIVDENNKTITEIDAFLENGDKVIVVEIKSKPKTGDIDEHIERMEKLRKYADEHNDQRAYLGAVAGVVFSESEKKYALKNGFYVIEPSGETFTITVPAGAYYPREW